MLLELPPTGRVRRLRRAVVGVRRDLSDPKTIEHVSVAAFLAWVGLGADGLSSSAYGPDEAYRSLLADGQPQLAIFLALATAATVAVLSYAYTRIIERFPQGGGGYAVAQTLGARAGVVSGCALLVDYVLTVATSIASATDAIFSNLPAGWESAKLPCALGALLVLAILNLRGVSESLKVLAPIFLAFVFLHALLIGGTLALAPGAQASAATPATSAGTGGSSLGTFALLLVLARAYSRGGGTYTGIEAVSNGTSIMREPRVATAKRTMLYLALSLALCSGGILVCYVLAGVTPEAGRTLNATLADRFVAVASRASRTASRSRRASSSWRRRPRSRSSGSAARSRTSSRCTRSTSS